MNGPRENAVRETLSKRPAGVLYDRDDERDPRVSRCFAGLFNGARERGHLSPDGALFVGKAECQWDWQEVWPRMVQMGLVEFTMRPRPNHPKATRDPFTALFEWRVTDYGREVRADDLAYFRELMGARAADREAASADDRDG